MGRYYDKECNSHFTEKSEVVDEDCFISKRVKRLVIDMATASLTVKHIAKSCDVSEHTVQRIINGVGNDLKLNILDVLPECIVFDEFKGVKNAGGNMSFIFIDNTNSQIVDILSDRRSFYLRNYFLAYPLKTRLRVKTITMDMYMSYMDVVIAISKTLELES